MLPQNVFSTIANHGRVLVVDDDEELRGVLTTALAFAGYTVDQSTNAVDGLKKALSLDYDVVLTDIVMPVIDGISFCNQLRKKKPHATVVMISGFSDFSTVRKAFMEGAYDFIRKPLKISEIELTLAKAMEQSRRCSIENNYREELIKRVTQQDKTIKKTHLNAILALASALNAKDTYTRHHGQRVADLATSIGKTMGLGDDTVKDLGLAGLLHDIGKIGVPDNILNKKGPLTSFEQKEIQKHPVISYEIVSQMFDRPQVLEAVIFHHERIDGTGYPRGLVDREIPLSAAILSVADVFDALTSRRSYRDSFCPTVALDVLRRHHGKRLHGKAIDALIKHFSSNNENAVGKLTPLSPTYIQQDSKYSH